MSVRAKQRKQASSISKAKITHVIESKLNKNVAEGTKADQFLEFCSLIFLQEYLPSFISLVLQSGYFDSNPIHEMNGLEIKEILFFGWLSVSESQGNLSYLIEKREGNNKLQVRENLSSQQESVDFDPIDLTCS